MLTHLTLGLTATLCNDPRGRCCPRYPVATYVRRNQAENIIPYRGAGGTQGGAGLFLLSLIMMIGGGYLLLNNMIIRPQFGFGTRAFSLFGMPITTGIILLPFIFGVGMIFYNARNWLGWLLALGALVAMVFGVLSNLYMQMTRMSVFELIVILVLLVGGIGLFLRSIFPFGSR